MMTRRTPTMTDKKGRLIVLSGPSGCGKGTVLANFFENYGFDNVRLSVSATTRSPRPGETNGVNYYFLTRDEFEDRISNDGFLEWACFCDNYYGTPKREVNMMLDEGIDVILEIEVQGAMKIMETVSDCVTVFVMPPSLEELRRRLTGRGTEKSDVIDKRIKAAEHEMQLAKKYTYVIVNEDVEDSAHKLDCIIQAERLKNN